MSTCFGVDRVTGKAFGKSLPVNLERLRADLSFEYKPRGLLAFAKPKDGGGNRIICVPTVADRIVQFSILTQIRPRLKRSGLDNAVSFGLAQGRPRSVLGARQFACGARDEHPWVYKSDFHKFFDNLNREVLRAAIAKVVPQRSLRPILSAFLDSEIEDGVELGWRKIVAEAGILPGVGVRQGMPLSPFFAGAYLRDLDRWLLSQPYPVARYVDDIVAFFDTEKDAREFHSRLKEQIYKLGLKIGEIDDPSSKTDLFNPNQPADFLGMEIKIINGKNRLCVSDKTVEKIAEKFSKLSTVDDAEERGVTLITLGGYFSSVLSGYVNAYDGAHNQEKFETKLKEISDGARLLILNELFGDKIETMSPAARRFVGIS
jgi:RNA-directed DNA polymerase